MSETETDETTGRAPPVDTTMDAWVGREADDVPPGWMDNVVKRLLKQMNRQLVLAEEAEDDKKNDARTRDMNSRSLVRFRAGVAMLSMGGLPDLRRETAIVPAWPGRGPSSTHESSARSKIKRTAMASR